MKDKDDILSKQIRKRLKDFEQPVPDHIWSAIEEDLVPTVSISNAKKLWRNISIAASFLLVMSLGSLFFLNRNSDDGQTLVENKVEMPVTRIPETKSDQTLLAENNTQDNAITENRSNAQPQKAFVSRQPNSQTSVNQSDNTGSSNAGDVNTKQENPVSQTSSATKPEEKTQQNQPNQRTSSSFENVLANNNGSYNIAIKRKKNTGISYALAVGNAGNFENNTGGGTGIMPSTDLSYTYSSPEVPVDFESQQNIYRTPQNDIKTPANYKHDLPISVGFTVRKQISDKLALESGLVYTYLASEGKIASTTPITNNISLHYLGIPVKGVYSLFNDKRFSVYASAGGMVEKSVSGTFKSTIKDVVESKNLNVKELQYSLTGSIGINVPLTGHLGLFVEPGIAYYFKDGSDVVTIRKDRPFNLNLQGGLRLSY